MTIMSLTQMQRLRSTHLSNAFWKELTAVPTEAKISVVRVITDPVATGWNW